MPNANGSVTGGTAVGSTPAPSPRYASASRRLSLTGGIAPLRAEIGVETVIAAVGAAVAVAASRWHRLAGPVTVPSGGNRLTRWRCGCDHGRRRGQQRPLACCGTAVLCAACCAGRACASDSMMTTRLIHKPLHCSMPICTLIIRRCIFRKCTRLPGDARKQFCRRYLTKGRLTSREQRWYKHDRLARITSHADPRRTKPTARRLPRTQSRLASGH